MGGSPIPLQIGMGECTRETYLEAPSILISMAQDIIGWSLVGFHCSPMAQIEMGLGPTAVAAEEVPHGSVGNDPCRCSLGSTRMPPLNPSPAICHEWGTRGGQTT